MITLLRTIFLARISLAIFLLLSLPVWTYVAVPHLLSLPADFTYEADIISRQKIYDPQVQDFGPETLSVGKLFYDVVGRKEDILSVRGIFNARGATKAKDRSVARIYGIDAHTREHMGGYGDRDRTGYLFAPVGLHKQDFVSWPVHYNAPASFAFKGETEIEGLSVYQYEAEFQTSDPPLISFYREEGDVPPNLRFEIRVTYWIEPISGRLVTYEDRAIGASVVPGQEPKPYSNSFYTPSRDSVLSQVQEANYEKWKAIIVTYLVPLGVTLLAIVLLVSLWHSSRTMERPGHAKKGHLPIVIPAVIILVLTLITLLAWRFAQRITDQQEQLWFSQEIDSMERAINVQIDVATTILENGLKQGFTTNMKERFDWKAYIDSIDSDQHYPGLEGVGFAAYIRANDRSAFLASMRSTDADFTISPSGDRQEYVSVMHFEALTKKVRPALGIDLLSDPNLSSTLLSARDTGTSVLSPKIVIARDQNGYEEVGVMLCTPVYQGGVRLSTTQERRNNLTGYLYHLIRVSELVEGALTNHNPAFRLQIFDGIWEYTPDKERELYARKISTLATDDASVLTKTRVSYLLDKAWTINFSASPDIGLTAGQRNLPTVVLIIGLVFSFLFSGIMYFLATSRRRAERIAQEMTRELSEEEGQVEKQRALLSLLLEHLPFGVFLSNAGTGETLLVNGAGKELLGDATNAVLMRNSPEYLSAFFRPDGQPYPKQEFPLDMTLSTGQVATKDDILMHRTDGRDIFIRATSALVQQDTSGEKGTDTILILEDITKEQEINRAKTDFVSLASHQLLTPLTAIGWYVEMLLAGDAGELNADQKQYLDEVSQGNKRMVTLVTDLLNVSRVDLGNLAVNPVPTDLPKTADSVLSELHSQTETKKLSILKEYDTTLTGFPSDPTILRILLQNLLSNAVKYTPDAGTIRVAITRGVQDINIIVADTGYGIPKAEQEKIFSKFFRAENARVNVAEGNGLGLYIVKFAVEQAGGTIRFESEEGKGTTFFVTFPSSGMVQHKGSKTLQ